MTATRPPLTPATGIDVVGALVELELEGAFDDAGLSDGAGLDHALGLLGAPPLIGDDRRLDLAVDLIELVERFRRLEREGTAALPDDLAPSVSRSRALEAELEHTAGEATSLVRRLAASLP